MNVLNAIRSSPWARWLTPQQLELVEETTTDRLVLPGDHACSAGGPVDHWLGVIKGVVKLCALPPRGRPTTFTIVPAGGWFGESSLLKGGRHQHSAVALSQSRMACIPRSTFEWLLDNSLGFNRYILTQLSERIGQSMSMICCGRSLGPAGRVARCLEALFNPVLYPGLECRVRLSQQELGHLSGLSRQRTNRALQALSEAGVLKVEYGWIIVLDRHSLRQFCA